MTSPKKQLEQLWSGDFGNGYVERNNQNFPGREAFWKAIFAQYPCSTVLEVGCNVGANLQWIRKHLPEAQLCGVDLNESALEVALSNVPDAKLQVSSATSLPFDDNAFDMTFTTGVLIHIARADLNAVMDEVVRCSQKYVLCGEYHADKETEILYRGEEGALFKDDYGTLYANRFPSLKLVDTGFLSRDDGGWDDVTYWLFEKQ